MPAASIVLAAALLAAADPKPAEPGSACDCLTLRDGTVVRGQVVESPAIPKGRVGLIVRRDWARDHAAAMHKRWEAAEAPTLQRARDQRMERLSNWRRDRSAAPIKDDVIGPWIDAQLQELRAAKGPTPLMLVTIARGDVRATTRASKECSRMLRQGWLARLPEVEAMTPDDLRQALAGRGFAMSDVDAAPVDALLPIPAEVESRWIARRAATEVRNEMGLRFIRQGGLILPEPEAGQEADAKQVLGAMTSLLQGVEGDMDARGQEVAERGRTGLVLTTLHVAEDMTVTVETCLHGRLGASHWAPVVSRKCTVRPGDLPRQAGAPLANDPQVKAAFKAIDATGIGEVTPEIRQIGLAVGAATRKALGEARAALLKEIEALALPVGPPPATPAAPASPVKPD